MDSLSVGFLLQSGKYKIVEVLGQGGFGITYLAEQVALGRKVAIKEFFMKDYCDRDCGTSHVSVPTENSRNLVYSFKQKFVKEAQMIASLRNPHIVSIYDIFEENGTAYYVMEFLNNGSLIDVVNRRGPVPEADALRFISQAGGALSYIHDRNILHLDIKPSNLLLNDEGEVVLIDFGISKHYDESGGQTSTTPVGVSKGYAPLEQYRDGDVSQFKPSTDIYALGATLYFLLSGLVPPDAAIVNEDGLDRPAGISDSVWNTIERAMMPRKKDRPQNIKEFLALLDIDNPAYNICEKNISASKHETCEETVVIMDNTDPEACILDGHEYVDLGLPSGTKWATCNIGAIRVEDAGFLYAWGETDIKDEYSLSNYVFCEQISFWGNPKVLNKYNTKTKFGKVDGLKNLEPIDDAASTVWSDKWRIPTLEQHRELIDNCERKRTTVNEVEGILFTSRHNGKTIFLPTFGTSNSEATDYGLYWSSTLDEDFPTQAYALFLSRNFGNVTTCVTQSTFRYVGILIRAVC
jgi:serine/threonine protein kinase